MMFVIILVDFDGVLLVGYAVLSPDLLDGVDNVHDEAFYLTEGGVLHGVGEQLVAEDIFKNALSLVMVSEVLEVIVPMMSLVHEGFYTV